MSVGEARRILTSARTKLEELEGDLALSEPEVVAQRARVGLAELQQELRRAVRALQGAGR